MEAENGIPITINELARMMNNSFENVIQMLKELQSEMKIVKTDIQSLKISVKRLEDGQEEIRLKLDAKAYQFDINDLDQRLKVLEKKRS